MTFGEKLQELRRASGMSQDTLAEKLDVSRQAVSKWERDEAMPETDKVVRIAQLFDVSIDYLLMNKEQKKPEPEPRYQYQFQSPRYEYTGYGRAEKFIRRHGYKFGYALMAVGAVICAICLLLYFTWPALANSFFGGFWDAADSIGSSMTGNFGVTIEGEIPAELEDELLDMIGGSSGGTLIDGFWGSATNSMQQSMNSAIRAQASLFLFGLIPGFILLAVGFFVVVKGKKIAQETLE